MAPACLEIELYCILHRHSIIAVGVCAGLHQQIQQGMNWFCYLHAELQLKQPNSG